MGKRNSGFPLKKVLLFGGGVLLVAALYKDRQRKSLENENKPVTGGSGSLNAIVNAGLNAASSSNTPGAILRRGSKGAFVKSLQFHINNKIQALNLDYVTLVLDGDFGTKTENAVLAMYGVKQGTLAQFTSMGTTPQMLSMKKVYTKKVTAVDLLNNFLNPFGK